MMAAIQPIAIKLDWDTRERIKRLADTRSRSMPWIMRGIMREAIRQYVDREEKREAFRQDAIIAWNEYQLTGIHAMEEEDDAWLADLESGRDNDVTSLPPFLFPARR